MTEHSQNGWIASPDPKAIGIVPLVVAGIAFPGGVKGGDVAWILSYAMNRYHHEVEPLHTPGCWGYAYRANRNDPNSLSNHSSGTAVDANAPKHPNGNARTFTAAQIAAGEHILAACHGALRWGQLYHSTVDGMHWEVNVDPATLAGVVKTMKAAAMRYPVLKFGSKGPAVLRYTVALNKHGFPTSDRDLFGNPTFTQTKKLQAKHGWPLTGIAGQREQQALGL